MSTASTGTNVLYTTRVETSPVDTAGNHLAEGAGMVVVALLLGNLLSCESARKRAGRRRSDRWNVLVFERHWDVLL